MQYFEIAPDKGLASYIKTYWFLEGTMPAAYLQPERVFPDGCMELIIHYGDAFQQITGNTTEKQATCFLYGQLENYIELLPATSMGVMGIKFYPNGLSHFTTTPVHAFNDQAVALEYVFKQGTEQLEPELLAAKNAAARAVIMNAFLLKCLRHTGKKNGLVQAMVNDIQSVKGNIAIKELVNRYHNSERQVERLFEKEVGLSPKLFSRIVRFQQVFQLAPAAQHLTSLALEAGYFDQAHFIREFKAFTGLSPRQYFSGKYELAALFLDD